MKVLVACEYSGRVRDSFIAGGHDAVSVDFLPSERPGPHIQSDVLEVIKQETFDLMIAHPPCTYLAVSGARWAVDNPERIQLQEQALEFVCNLMNAPIHKKAIENPVSIISSRIMKPTQIIQPWWFGDLESKKTCLWLFNLPPLVPTYVLKDTDIIKTSVHFAPPGENRWKDRSRTFQGFANAMAEQWGV